MAPNLYLHRTSRPLACRVRPRGKRAKAKVPLENKTSGHQAGQSHRLHNDIGTTLLPKLRTKQLEPALATVACNKI